MSRRFVRMLTTMGLLALLMALFSVPAFAQDPNGAETLAADAGAPLTFIWLIVSSALVFFMQAGFLLVEAGFARAKNTVNIVTKNMIDFVIAALAFWAFGYAFMYGDGGVANNFIGLTGFGLFGDGYDVTNMLSWVFQLVFAATAATIVSGAMAERTKITSYMAYSFLVTALLYPIYGKWVWGGGWLAQLGAHDFAGSGRGARAGRRCRPGRGDAGRAAHRQVRAGWQGKQFRPAQHGLCGARHPDSGLWLDRL